ncbi:MAG: sigma-70 family RNA polymerase sigma factor [Saprospiraceae bacterium]
MDDKTTDIIRLLKQQDKKSIEILYDQYGAALYGVVLKIVQAETLAEDVLQDTFVKIWRNGATYDSDKGTLFTWMLNIARNTAIDTIKSAAYRHGKKIQEVDFSVYDHKDWRVEQHPEHIGLQSAVNGLEEKYRLIIDLAYFQGYTQQEIVEYLSIPLGTVKSRVKIGLRELKKLFLETKVWIWFTYLMLLLEVG